MRRKNESLLPRRLEDLAARSAARPVHDRLRTLRARTLGVGVLAALGLVVGARLVLRPLGDLLSWGYSLLLGPAGFGRPHVPHASGDLGSDLTQWALVVTLSMAVIGHSVGAFGRTPLRVVMLVPLAVLVVITVFVPATASWLNVWPGAIEREIVRGRFESTQARLGQLGYPEELRSYVQAQMALRVADDAGLRVQGAAVLERADAVVYGYEVRANALALQYKPEIVLAIDRGMHGAPLSEVGIREASGSVSSRTGRRLAMAMRALAGLACLGLVWPLLRLWNEMRLRGERIRVEWQGE
jgi:hypothetical protein